MPTERISTFFQPFGRDIQLTAKLIAFLCLAGALVGISPCLFAAENWKAGVARVKITPEPGLWMAGYAFRDHPAEGTLQDLWAKALVLEDAAGARAVIFSADFLGFNRPLATYVTEEVGRRYGIPRERILLGCTHTHCGPVIDGALFDVYPLDDSQRQRIAQYTRWLRDQMVAVIGQALQQLEPVELLAGQGEADFAVNRRNNREPDVPKLREAGQIAGPSDFRVPVLAVRRRDGSFLAILFQYACHTTVLGIYQWHGDYAGCAQLALEKRYPGATAIFLIGCGADQNALPRRSVELAEAYGQRLADAVVRVLEGSPRPIAPRLRASLQTVRLDYEPVDRPFLEESAKQTNYVSRWAKRLLAALEQGETFPTWYPYPVQVWLLGEDQWWVALGGEVVVDYALRVGEIYGPSVWVTGYANDVMAYIPSHRVWQEGGYESGAFSVYGLPAKRWCEDIEDRILRAVAQGMEACRQQAASTPSGKPSG